MCCAGQRVLSGWGELPLGGRPLVRDCLGRRAEAEQLKRRTPFPAQLLSLADLPARRPATCSAREQLGERPLRLANVNVQPKAAIAMAVCFEVVKSVRADNPAVIAALAKVRDSLRSESAPDAEHLASLGQALDAAKSVADTVASKEALEKVGELLSTARDLNAEDRGALLSQGLTVIEVFLPDAPDEEPSDQDQADQATPEQGGSDASAETPSETEAKADASANGGSDQGDDADFMDDDDSDAELVEEFVLESRDYLADAEGALLQLEQDPDDSEAIGVVFRAFHTIKGVSAVLDFNKVAEFAHHAESFLIPIREGELPFTALYADLALEAVDKMRALVESVAEGKRGNDIEGLDTLMARFHAAEKQAREGGPPPVASPAPSVSSGDAEVEPSDVAAEQADDSASAVAEGAAPAGGAPADPASDKLEKTESEPEPASAKATPAKTGTSKPVKKASANKPKRNGGGRKKESSEDAWVRVRTDRLDSLLDMVGELVIAQSMVGEDENLEDAELAGLSRKVARSSKILRELQDLSLSLRMLPVKGTFQKMFRVVRDTAQRSGKEAKLVTAGDETEVDRKLVDMLADPLVHMVRNAVDHGIESAEERVKAGKPPGGTIELKAFHSGGNVVIQLSDDGKGLDRSKIVAKAKQTGIIESDAGMSDAEVFALIFEAGFSTSAQVTDISGRGVGMDVVRRGIEELSGRIQITSTLGMGTTFRVHVPLTLAITDGMLVRVGAERFIIPTVSIQRSFQPTQEQYLTVASKGEMIAERGRAIPLFRVDRLLGIRGGVDQPTSGIVVVVGEHERGTALLVDELLGKQQVVVKNLGNGIGKVGGISGGAILGDGRVGLILDPPSLIENAHHESNLFAGPELTPAAQENPSAASHLQLN